MNCTLCNAAPARSTLCDRCWELKTRVESDPELAKSILNKWQEGVPKHGNQVLLLVVGGEHPMQDAREWTTVGYYQESEGWLYPGWDWVHDCYINNPGGEVIGWRET